MTIGDVARGLYREKGSKFLSFAYPVSSEAEVKCRVEALKKQYFDARHHCFAYRIGPGGERRRASDDGEPAHSAGDPILGQITARGLTDTLVVVVRYFGGILLGTGGLVQAYRTAAKDALDRAVLSEKVMQEQFVLTFGYEAAGAVERLFRTYAARTLDYRSEEVCRVTVEVRKALSDGFLADIGQLHQVAVKRTDDNVGVEEEE